MRLLREGVAVKLREGGRVEAAHSQRCTGPSAVDAPCSKQSSICAMPEPQASALRHGTAAAQAMRLSRELAAVQAGAEARAEAAEERIAALQAAVERLTAEAGAAADLAATREQARLQIAFWVSDW